MAGEIDGCCNIIDVNEREEKEQFDHESRRLWETIDWWAINHRVQLVGEHSAQRGMDSFKCRSATGLWVGMICSATDFVNNA